MRFALWVTLFALAVTGPALTFAAEIPPDPLVQRLDAAKAAHNDAINKANAELMRAFDEQSKSLGAGDADTAKALSAQKVAFASSGTLPASPLMKSTVDQYQETIHTADSALTGEFDAVSAEYEKTGNFDLAMKVRQERRAMVVPLGDQTSDTGDAPTAAVISTQLDQAKQKYKQTINDAKLAFVNTIDQRIDDVSKAGDLNAVESLQAAKAMATVDGSLVATVKDDAVLAAHKHEQAAVKEANSQLALAYQKAIRDYTRGRNYSQAKDVQKEFAAVGLANSTNVDIAEGAYQLGSQLPEFLTLKSSVFATLPKHLGIYVPENSFIRTRAGNFLSKDFTCDVWLYIAKDIPDMQPAYVGIGEGTKSLTDDGPQDSLYLHISPPNKSGGEVNLHKREASNKVTIGHLKDFDTYIVRIEKSGNSISFSVGTEESGNFVAGMTSTIADIAHDAPFLNAENGHLFFGSGAFRQIRITSGPQPVKPVALEVPAAKLDPGNAAPSATATGSTHVLANPKVVNLMPLIDVDKDAVTGVWTLKNGELTSDAPANSRLAIPYQPPAEYDFHIKFTKTKGYHEVTQLLSHGNHQFEWMMAGGDSPMYRFILVQDKDVKGNPTVVKPGPVLSAGKQHDSVVKVRNDSITALIDGQIVTHFKTDFSDISPERSWLLDDHVLGVGNFKTDITFQLIEVVEISGPGKLLPADPTTPTPKPATPP